ncbi:MAG TPA: peptidoglycan glycosyltransferase [Candidatus Scybalocola faecavium]|nr:peptidoglycan glycosyltransferase [Candidatus Scybalocola faecavium]
MPVLLFYHRKKVRICMWVFLCVAFSLIVWLSFLMIPESGYYEERASDLHERERTIKAARGRIYDRNGIILADNQSVCTVTVIHNQITDPDQVIEVLSRELDMDPETVRQRVEKVSSIERIKSNVPKATGDVIRSYKLDGVNVDEDYARYYPYGTLASKVLGFTGGDNQGIIGLEVKYDEYLQGTEGLILTTTDVRGLEVENTAEKRVEPVNGMDLYLSIDYNMQAYAQQVADKMLAQKEAKGVSIILMNPQNGEIYAMVNAPEFDLNEPYVLTSAVEENQALADLSENDKLNQMWRNTCINDTYEPGSTFKIITAASALEDGVVSLNDTFSCPGYCIVEDRRIRCHKTTGHGSETFLQGFMNSCNPVFINVGARVGIDSMYSHFTDLGLFEKTGVDLPGESGSIMHDASAVGAVELATISFGQSFQITPLQLLRSVSAIINGGTLVTPHFAVSAADRDFTVVEKFQYGTSDSGLSEATCETMKMMLEKVVSEGTGNKAYIEGYSIGGKTATSQKLPRNSGKYIASFLGFAPADDPQIIGLILIDEPVGTYYGGTIAAPVMKEVFENVLPYLNIEKNGSNSSDEETAA